MLYHYILCLVYVVGFCFFTKEGTEIVWKSFIELTICVKKSNICCSFVNLVQNIFSRESYERLLGCEEGYSSGR